MTQQAVFFVLAAIALGGAVGVVFARSVFVSALWLVVSLVGVAGLYVLLEAGFLAVMQILVYVGAISVLILFAVMLTRQVMGGSPVTNRQWHLALVVTVAVFGLLGVLTYGTQWPLSEGRVLPAAGGSAALGAAADEAGLTEEGALAIVGARLTHHQQGDPTVDVPGPVTMLGTAFVTNHLLAFELVSAILLVALVGAVVIARE